MKCGNAVEVYSRIVGYFRPVTNWNRGKKQEFKDRILYNIERSMNHEIGSKQKTS